MKEEKILDQVRDTLRRKNFTYCTEQTPTHWTWRIIYKDGLLLSFTVILLVQYNHPQINYHDVYGDQYPALLFRESPVGARGLEVDGEIPSVIRTFRVQSGQSVRGGTSLPQRQYAVREPARPLPRTNETAITR